MFLEWWQKSLSPLCTVGKFLTHSAALGHLKAGAGRPPVGTAGNVTEHLSEPGGHEVVEDGVNGGAQVEKDS